MRWEARLRAALRPGPARKAALDAGRRTRPPLLTRVLSSPPPSCCSHRATTSAAPSAAMGRRSSGRKLPFFTSNASSSSSSKRTRSARRLPSLPKPRSPTPPSPSPASPSTPPPATSHPSPLRPPLEVAPAAAGGGSGKVGKKKAGARLWMRFDRRGVSETVHLDKGSIIRRAGLPPRDLRILGPVFSESSNILAREKAMVINLEFIRAIVTSDEILLLEPLALNVLPFVDQLTRHLSLKSLVGGDGQHGGDGRGEKQDYSPRDQMCLNEATGAEHELPFEFQVLELALETVCSSFDINVSDLERRASPVLEELTKNVSKKNLDRVRTLKSDLTRPEPRPAIDCKYQLRSKDLPNLSESSSGDNLVSDDLGSPIAAMTSTSITGSGTSIEDTLAAIMWCLEAMVVQL
ncbi:hypothetical protein GUJ93_ZPchr0010g8019 [Zizania palustris]|uniref:Magnesium transporter n=1 Tax=Zizania palustris TaxID=103762 RepID=A0A8J5TIE0_ZIZPA|nr:hypothetical protein GUJ93_ZPchr0010g8019 [Zizania palustris]